MPASLASQARYCYFRDIILAATDSVNWRSVGELESCGRAAPPEELCGVVERGGISNSRPLASGERTHHANQPMSFPDGNVTIIKIRRLGSVTNFHNREAGDRQNLAAKLTSCRGTSNLRATSSACSGRLRLAERAMALAPAEGAPHLHDSLAVIDARQPGADFLAHVCGPAGRRIQS
jgi:hypothetical protein